MLHLRKTFLFASLIAGTIVLMSAGDVVAQGRGGGGFGGRGFGGRGNGMDGLLRRDDVRTELELTDEQIEDLQGLQEGGFEGMREAMREMRDEGLSRDEMRERMMEMRDERQAEVKENLEKILLPFQFKRLQQISNQAAVRGGTRGILNGPIADKLKITDEQKEKIEAKAEKLQKELNEKIEKMREEMREKILDELTSGQRKEFEEMMGESFSFEQDDRRGGDRRGGDRRGGDRRGGDRRGQRPDSDFDV